MSSHPNQFQNPPDTRVCRDGAWRAERLFVLVNRLKPMPELELPPSLSLIPCMVPEEK